MHTFVSAEAEELDLTGERILDAALEQFELEGIRGSSVEAVARRAGVTRVTVYRRFARKDELVRAVVAREAIRLIAAEDERTAAIGDPEERMVEAFVAMLELVRDHALTRRLLELEPESVLRALTVDAAPVVALGIDHVAQQIRRGQDEGAFAEFDPEPAAELLVRLAHSLVLTPGGGADLGDEDAARAFARDHIMPLLVR